MSTISQPKDAVTPPVVDTAASDDLSVEIASQWKLMWWKFRRHRLAVVGLIVVAMFYFVAIFADFFAPVGPETYSADFVYAPPQTIKLVTADGTFLPHVNGYGSERDPVSFKKTYFIDENVIVPIGLFVHGEPYKILGVIPSDIHLIGPIESGAPFYLMGGDRNGRDSMSRIIFSSRVSLSIGLVGVGLSFILGVALGGLSGLMGGTIDNIIQRMIEITVSIPDLPIIVAIAAVVPIETPVTTIYFIITVMLAALGWTGLARVVRGKFLSLREEDFVLAAKLDGAKSRRLIFRHMLPSFYSHIIASVTLALPGMILAETALSFLGVGLRPPVVSWGVLLQEAQRVNVIASYPWLLFPAGAVILMVLAFNFLGDGLRDAADPY